MRFIGKAISRTEWWNRATKTLTLTVIDPTAMTSTPLFALAALLVAVITGLISIDLAQKVPFLICSVDV
jgi:hypothetical protein